MDKFITRTVDVTEVSFITMKNDEMIELTETIYGVKLDAGKAEKALKKMGHDRVMVKNVTSKSVKAEVKLEDFMNLATITE